MHERLIFAGSGGQGLLTVGKIVALAAMREDLNVTWYPSYGAEVRGGTAHCHVVIKNGEIYSPLVEEATALVVMNGPSLMRFLPRLAEGGLVVLNTSLAAAPREANGTVVCVPATDIANELKQIRVANMAMLGALNARKKLVADETVERALAESLGSKGKALLAANLAAYAKGREAAL